MKKILFVINNGFEEAETIVPYDMLKRMGYLVKIMSNTKEVKGSHNLVLLSDEILNETNYKDFDLVVLPGGPEYNQNKNDQLYLNVIKYYIENKALACICATPTILGSLGYLKNKKYTCFTPMNEDFGGSFTNSKSEIDGNLITGRSAGCALDFSFNIVKYLSGEDGVKKLKEDIIY